MKMTGYNWRSTISDHAAISGVLAGFSVSLIGLIIGGAIADIIIHYINVTFGQLAVLFFGLATGLFVAASELFLYAKSYDIYDIPEDYYHKIEKAEDVERDWEEKYTSRSRKAFNHGRLCFNSAVFIMFIGLFFVITPYNLYIGLIVSGFGLVLEIWQMFR